MNIETQAMLPIGTMLHDTYRIEEYLSSGGFGNTYVVTNVQFEERLALKEFFMKGINQREGQTTVSVSNSENVGQFGEQLEKFKKEARRLRRLENENIVRVHDLFEENGTAYYVMDLIDGESLSDRMKRLGRPLTEAEVMALLPQVLNALDGMHAQQLWHLDLKPGNIMVDRQGRAVLIDFGASKQMDVASQGYTGTSSAMCYTPGFAPTEQIDGSLKLIGPWTDFYAFGATIYNLLTRQQPPSAAEIMMDGVNAFQFPASVSDDLRMLVVWLMNARPASRPQSAAAIRQRLELIKGRKASAEAVGVASSEATQLHQPAASEPVSAAPASKPEPAVPPVKTPEPAASPAKSPEPAVASVNQSAPRKVLYPKKKSSSKVAALLAACGILLVLLLAGVGGGWYLLHNRNADVSDSQEMEQTYSPELVRLAEEGDAEAQYLLGRCYFFGNGIAQDFTEAVSWYRKAAEQGYAAAQDRMGVCYYWGSGVNQDYTEAVSWFRKAVEQGYPDAQFNLGSCYERGHGVTQNSAEAIKWYKKAAEQGYMDAYMQLGHCYYDGSIVSQDYAEAVKWYRQAAEQGSADGQLWLGICYYNGRGVSQNYSEGAEWYQKAAEQGNTTAQNNLGLCYYMGKGVSQDYAEAVRWFRVAAELGDATAQYNLGTCYEDGEGVSKNKNEAVEWYRKAADQGYESAIQKLRELGYEWPNKGGMAYEEEKQVEAEPEVAQSDVAIGAPEEKAEEVVNTSGTVTPEETAPEEDTRVFDVVEQMPQFPGGDAALMEYISKNIKYPVIAEENGIQGRVVCQFVVERDGSVSDVRVVRSVDPALDKEAIRVIKAMPKWTPGRQNGAPVRTKFTLPVTFRLQG